MRKIALVLTLFFVLGTTYKSEAQILKGFGKKIEKKINDRIDRKADRSVDKVLDKADKETDKPLDGALNKSTSNSKATEKELKKKKEEEAAKAKQKEHNAAVNSKINFANGLLMMPGGNCSEMIWFKSGAMMEYQAVDGKGKQLNKTKMEIVKVYNEGSVTVADVITSDDQGNEFNMNFKCAGDKMYMDFGALLKQAMDKAGQSGANKQDIERIMANTEINFEDGFMSFPKNMAPGMLLEDVSVTIKVSPTPQMSMNVSSTLTDRKVEAKEKITTKAGTFDCIRISGKRKTSMQIMGRDQKMDDFTEYMWFAPGIGMIQQEDRDGKGKIGTTMQLVAFRR